ncbi:MAG: hypothetical protein IT442_05735 [Phycisphaeraceae bacterium]|nr:hypothetical protein [Phycisphaeraceae bacterium]
MLHKLPGRASVRLSMLALSVMLLAVGCTPKGSTGGRIDPYRTTAADAASKQASIPALLEFSDQTAGRLAYDLSEIPEIKQAPTRVVLELGDISNKTRTSTGDYELIQHRLRANLMQSKLIRDHFKIVEGRARMDRELNRVAGPGAGDILQEEGSAGQTATYDPAITYVLQGDFFEADRGGRRQYFFEFKLTNLKSRDIVFSSSYDLGQVSY